MKRLAIFLMVAGTMLAAGFEAVQLSATYRVGATKYGVLLPTGDWVTAEGVTALLHTEVIDGVVGPDGITAFLKTSSGVAVEDLSSGRVLQQTKVDGGSSMVGICVSPDGKTLACSGAGSIIDLFEVDGRQLKFGKKIKLPAAAVGGDSYPCGLQFLDSSTLVVAASRDNSVLVVSTIDGKVRTRAACNPAPYSVLLLPDHRVIVSCWGRAARVGAESAPSSGTPVEVDERGISPGGSIDLVNLKSGAVDARVLCLGQPTDMKLAGGVLYVALANGDSVGMFDARTLESRGFIAKSDDKAASPDSIAIDSNLGTLYVAYGGLDAVESYDLKSKKFLGSQGTDWYPTVVRTSPSGGLMICTAKGIGSRSVAGPKHQVYDVTGSVSYESNPDFGVSFAVRDVGKARGTVTPVPVPARLGEPSVFKHVVYVIKENRTYDQVLGDLGRGDSDPRLVMYGKDVTPNHHALASEFATLDNYYCNGILSADGHAWATEANATTFYEHSRGGWTRSYPFGDDPLATSSTGYLWDNALSHGVSVRNFGEFDYASPDPDMSAAQIYAKFIAGDRLEFKQNIGVARLRRVSVRDFPGWNLAIPDVLRADRFIKHLHEEEQANDMAALTVLYFPQDHTSGGSRGFPSPRAQVADNDLGLGRAIEAISHSKFWASTVVFVNEDDPQDGFDHVDGHRSFCFVVSPYTKRGAVVSDFFNQASVVGTIERILGLPTMNHNDAEAPLMDDCFNATPDLTPYVAKPNRIPLDEKLGLPSHVSFKLDKPDEVDDDAFNRRLWALARPGASYPGARGLDK